ncbi:hypothetical protein NDU88_004098 [Pleurodeles waltl]|uniref:Uncharacterized protein n=1 Tax=Pleurodeles waltl TaxID=8319 RepID=A0AAV7VIY6_PLEWA|nr:hypothetical protein NDU88_004098 [Pleurodeles waltl]
MLVGVVSWSQNIPEPVATEERKEWKEQEDEEPGITETTGRTSVFTGQSGAEGPQRERKTAGPGEPALEPPRFRRSVAFPGTDTRTGKGAGKGGGRWRRAGKGGGKKKENGHFGDGEH